MTDATTAALADALRKKFKTPADALAALGMDAALLGDDEERKMGKLSPGSARRLAEKLKSSTKMAMDASLEDLAELLQQVEGIEGDGTADPNAGIPAFLSEHPSDGDGEYETEEERRRDDGYDRRVMDARRMLGRDETEEEGSRREEEMEFKPDASKEGEDRRRAMDVRIRTRADDARRRLGRDETPEEKAERERREEGEDRKRASDRFQLSRDYRRARDAHRSAMDVMKRHAGDWKQATDACGGAASAEDRKRADDSRRKVADDIRRAHDAVVRARDARAKARDARRAHDEPPEFKGMPKENMVSKEAMDAAIEDRVSKALSAERSRNQAIMSAIEEVRPKVGKIAMDSSLSDEGVVYAKALDILGVPHAGITQVAALRQMVAMSPRPGSRDGHASGLATDAAPPADSLKTFRELFPGAALIERM